MAPETQVVEQFVVMFPSAAAWLLVIMVGVIGTGIGVGGRKFLKRLDSQDTSLDMQNKTLAQIKDLLASEIAKLREMHHDMDKRVIVLETLQNGGMPKRRATDSSMEV